MFKFIPEFGKPPRTSFGLLCYFGIAFILATLIRQPPLALTLTVFGFVLISYFAVVMVEVWKSKQRKKSPENPSQKK